jgi:hypothetical protein
VFAGTSAGTFFDEIRFEFSRWWQLVEAFLEVADDAENFIEGGHFAEEHFAAHFLIIFAPSIKVVSGRYESERAGMERGVVHP